MRALLSFFTVLPVRSAPLEAVAERAYLLPLVGLFTGAPGAALILLAYAVPPGVVATLALGAVLLAAGLHHTDGVLDAGDALMVRGTQERRRAVLKDARVGIGGIGALFVVYAPTLAALAALPDDSPARLRQASRGRFLLCFLRPVSTRLAQSVRRVAGPARAAALPP